MAEACFFAQRYHRNPAIAENHFLSNISITSRTGLRTLTKIIAGYADGTAQIAVVSIYFLCNLIMQAMLVHRLHILHSL